MLPLDFHPVLREWWDRRFAEPTDAQLEGWKAIRRGDDTLIAAPTGSGKTLAAFLTSLDQLLREGVEQGGLPDEVRVIYVSPLKALSADIHKNLAEPRREIHALAPQTKITAAVRSGDTPQNERASMLRTPPHILVTTPESLYLLLTAERSRAMLKTARVVIVDEIHAVLQSRRGAHLALSLERLDHVCGRQLQRIGLSATQKPIEEVAKFLSPSRPVAIVDRGHKRKMDLAVEVPSSPLEAVMSHEVWAEIYQRLVQLIEGHRTTLITVNTRRLAERMAHQLSERLGAEFVAAHHGS
ncbi:MAG TPA: DEAD/DEAH box helicase, partial [Burkholderiales bacterium]|nr:DEAD/DEAH box helicase [Burkholderiales bacterium]